MRLLKLAFDDVNEEISDYSQLNTSERVKKYLFNFEWVQVRNLPKNFTYKGFHLDLSDTRIFSLPEGLHTFGALFLQRTDVKELPSKLVIEGNLNLIACDVISLPSYIWVVIFGLV